jgi:hypothetical protein
LISGSAPGIIPGSQANSGGIPHSRPDTPVGPHKQWFRRSPAAETARRHAPAEPLLEDVFTIALVTARQPRRPDGHLDWRHLGPHGDAEWGCSLNRRHFLLVLLEAWYRTGNRA